MKYLKNYFFKNYFFLSVSALLLMFSPVVQALKTPEQPGQPKFSQADIDSLNLSDTDAQALQELTQLLNTMSPEEQEAFAQIGQEIDRQMKDKGLDPSNPDDIFKFMEQQEPAADKPKPASPQPEPAKPVTPVVAPVQIASSPDAKALINTIIRHIGALRQKARENGLLYRRLERLDADLVELVYYLSLLTNESLLAYVASKDFGHIYKSLERLRATLTTYEPQIITPEITFAADQGNPYDILQLSPRASDDEIDLAYQALRETNDPELLAKKLKKTNLSSKEQAKKLKEAQLSFKFIHNAYSILKDPKQRALLDRSIREQYENEKMQEQAVGQASIVLLDALNAVLREQNLVQEIKQLLEKHKPKELEMAKAQDALEKKAADRLNKPIKIETRFNLKPVTDPYAAFYDQVRQDAARFAQQQASIASRRQETRPEKPELKNGDKPTTGPDAKNGPAKPADQKKKDDKAAADKKGQPKAPSAGPTGPSGQPTSAPGVPRADQDKKQELSEKDEGAVEGLITKIARESEQIRDSFAPDQDSLTRGPDGAKPKTLAQAAQELDKSLTQPITRANIAETQNARIFAEFINQRDMKDLVQDMRDLWGKVKGKQVPAELKKLWKEKVFDTQGARMLSWYKTAYPVLSGMARGGARKSPIATEKQKLYGLNKPEPDVAKKQEKPKQPTPAISGFKLPPAPQPAVDKNKLALDTVRDTISELAYLFKQLSGAFGATGEPRPPVKKQ